MFIRTLTNTEHQKRITISEEDLKQLRNIYDISCSPSRCFLTLQTPESLEQSWKMIVDKIAKENGVDLHEYDLNLQEGYFFERH